MIYAFMMLQTVFLAWLIITCSNAVSREQTRTVGERLDDVLAEARREMHAAVIQHRLDG